MRNPPRRITAWRPDGGEAMATDNLPESRIPALLKEKVVKYAANEGGMIHPMLEDPPLTVNDVVRQPVQLIDGQYRWGGKFHAIWSESGIRMDAINNPTIGNVDAGTVQELKNILAFVEKQPGAGGPQRRKLIAFLQKEIPRLEGKRARGV